MCFANAAVVAANLREYIQPLIKEHSYAWVTSSKVPGGCGKGPASECCHRQTFGCVIYHNFLFQTQKDVLKSVCDKMGTR